VLDPRHLLLGCLENNRREEELIDLSQRVLANRIIHDPESLDGSEIDALVGCLNEFDLDSSVLFEAQQEFLQMHDEMAI